MMQSEKCLGKDPTDHAFRHRDAVDSGGLYVSHYHEEEPARSTNRYLLRTAASLAQVRRRKDVPMNLMPPDSISQAATRAVPNQNSRRRSCGLSYIYDYVGMPQGGQYSSFLAELRSIDPSSIWLWRLKNDQLEQWKR